ncbi:MAG: hypothetical protein Q9207_004321, partial [Kuettlingeria erythrocarpa]
STAQEPTRTTNTLNTQASQNSSGQRRDPRTDWDLSESFNAFTLHSSRDGLASESKGTDRQDPEQPEGAQEGQRSIELHNAGSDGRWSPKSAAMLTSVRLQAQAKKDERRNRQGSWQS